MRTLAIDFGSKRIGLALSDEGGKFATPLDVLQVSSLESALRPITDLIKKESVTRIVLGLPLNMDDSIGPAAKAVVKWGDELASRTALPVIYVDERLSTFAAEQSLIDRKRGGEKITRKAKKERLDALVAAGFLQAYLDGKLAAIDVANL